VNEQLRAFYEEALRFYDPKRQPPSIHVTFYPYVGINHTIRIRNGEIYVRIGELCREMPPMSQRGLAYILMGKLLRKRIPEGAREIYEAYIDSDKTREKATHSKKTRGRKVVTTSKGDVYDLDEIFDKLNNEYFESSVKKPVLTWSANKTYRILGHHDATHDHVAISRSLDSKDVPEYVVESVVHHEMLHIVHPTKHLNGRRYNHTPAFRRDERKFVHFDAAERWIERNIAKIRRAIRKKK